ncbi:hypothetical protein JCM8208_003039 [Rhodotorula glutinis]
MKVCVFGGNGFVGSAVARKAVARGWHVVSVSRSGTPFATPAGHTPSWVNEVEWRKGSPFDPATYDSVLGSCDALVSTLGTLFETTYKDKGVAKPLSVLKALAENLTGSRGNPLARDGRERSYERLNRDSALALFDAFHSSRSPSSSSLLAPSPFVFISAEDIFRPFVPARYIQTKRQAEAEIWRRACGAPAGAEGGGAAAGIESSVRPVFVRPSLMYHPHLNPPSTLPATLLEATSHLHALVPPSLHLLPQAPSPLPNSAPSLNNTDPAATQLPSALTSLSSLLSIPPIHVDAIGEAVCRAIADEHTRGVVDVGAMRDMLGFDALGWGGSGAGKGRRTRSEAGPAA